MADVVKRRTLENDTKNYELIKEYEFFKKLCAFPFVDEIWLYGSRARGTNSDRSDIDLAIVCPRATDREWYAVREVIEDADTLFKIDCVRFDVLSASNTFRKSIMNDRIVLYLKGEKRASQ